MSKLTQLFACFSLMGSSMLAQSSPDLKLPYWQDVQTTSVNKEAPRTSFMTYADRTQAMSGQFEKVHTTNYSTGHGSSFMSMPTKTFPPTSPLLLQAQRAGTTFKCRATGKYKASERPFILITATSSNLINLSRPYCPNRIP